MAQKGRRTADDAILLALACGATIENAARSAGVSQSTVYRRLNDPQFKERLGQIRSEMVSRTAGALTAAATEAVKTLLSLQQAQTPPAVRLGAARAVLELGVKLRESAELESRITSLERLLNPALDS